MVTGADILIILLHPLLGVIRTGWAGVELLRESRDIALCCCAQPSLLANIIPFVGSWRAVRELVDGTEYYSKVS